MGDQRQAGVCREEISELRAGGARAAARNALHVGIPTAASWACSAIANSHFVFFGFSVVCP